MKRRKELSKRLEQVKEDAIVREEARRRLQVKPKQGDLDAKRMKGVWETVAFLEHELKKCRQDAVEIKKQIFFPTHQNWRYVFAIEDPGVYIAFEDMEIEYLRGRVEARLENAGTSPTGRARLSLRTVSGINDSDGTMKVDTLSLKLRVVHFKLNGDKGSRVPNISYSQLSLTADVECELDFQYAPNNSKKNAKAARPRT